MIDNKVSMSRSPNKPLAFLEFSLRLIGAVGSKNRYKPAEHGKVGLNDDKHLVIDDAIKVRPRFGHSSRDFMGLKRR
jgi:hypothetical protein